jgi:hypothetical protein
MVMASGSIIFDILDDILEVEPNHGATTSGLSCLRAMAHDGNFEAAKRLAVVLGHKMGYGSEHDFGRNAKTLADFMQSNSVPELLRIYVMGFFPTYYVQNKAQCESLADAVKETNDIEAFQRLVRWQSPFEHEVLKAFVLTAFVGVASLTTFVSRGAHQSILDTIMSDCRVVEGEAAHSGLEFGRDTIRRYLKTPDFLGVIAHELGHHIFKWGMVDRHDESANTQLADPIPEDAGHLEAISVLIHRLKNAAANLRSHPLEPGDSRIAQTEYGLRVID